MMDIPTKEYKCDECHEEFNVPEQLGERESVDACCPLCESSSFSSRSESLL